MKFEMSNSTYDFLKKLIQIWIPAGITCFVALANIWHWEIPTEAIVASVTAVTAFLGIVLNISTHNYNNNSTEA